MTLCSSTNNTPYAWMVKQIKLYLKKREIPLCMCFWVDDLCVIISYPAPITLPVDPSANICKNGSSQTCSATHRAIHAWYKLTYNNGIDTVASLGKYLGRTKYGWHYSYWIQISIKYRVTDLIMSFPVSGKVFDHFMQFGIKTQTKEENNPNVVDFRFIEDTKMTPIHCLL